MHKMDRKEPFWWGLFSIGGVVAALFVPVHIFVDGLAVPLGLMDESVVSFERMHDLLAHPLAKVYLFVLVILPLFHAAHRVRFSLYELGVRDFQISMDFLCYGAAVVGTALCGYVFFRLL
jgi:fumarate reductase subunit D